MHQRPMDGILEIAWDTKTVGYRVDPAIYHLLMHHVLCGVHVTDSGLRAA